MDADIVPERTAGGVGADAIALYPIARGTNQAYFDANLVAGNKVTLAGIGSAHEVRVT